MAKHAADKRLLSVLVPVSYIDEIDRIAAKMQLTRSELVRNIIDVGLDQVRVIDKTGAFGAVGVFRRLVDTLREKGDIPTPEK